MNKFTSGLTKEKMTRMNSIHPRVSGGKTIFKKSNTCGKAAPSKKENLILALMVHVESHPRDIQSVSRLTKLQA